MPDANLEIVRKETFLKALENSVGATLFNSVFMREKDTGEVKDILNNGELACAYFVTSMLMLVGGLSRQHATVKATRGTLDKNESWSKVQKENVRSGDVIVWEKMQFETGTCNEHIGFALNGKEAVSTNYEERAVIRHHITYGETDDGKPFRNIIEVWRWSEL